jgi:hypothetical protein
VILKQATYSGPTPVADRCLPADCQCKNAKDIRIKVAEPPSHPAELACSCASPDNVPMIFAGAFSDPVAMYVCYATSALLSLSALTHVEIKTTEF